MARVGQSCAASVAIDAPVEAVWALISDVTRTGEWSVECCGADWLGGVTGPAVGARFRGRNRRNLARWSRTCELLATEPPRRLAWRTLPTRLLPDSTQWEFDLSSDGRQTTLTERMQVLQIPGLHDRVFAMMLPQHRDRTADLEADLQRIKTAVETRTRRTTA